MRSNRPAFNQAYKFKYGVRLITKSNLYPTEICVVGFLIVISIEYQKRVKFYLIDQKEFKTILASL